MARVGCTIVNKKQKTTSVRVQAIHGLWEDVPGAASTEGGGVEDGVDAENGGDDDEKSAKLDEVTSIACKD